MKRTSTHRKTTRKFVVKHPATARDFRRAYGMTPGLLKEAKRLEKKLCPA